MVAQCLDPSGRLRNAPSAPMSLSDALGLRLATRVFPYSTHARTEPLNPRKGRDTFSISFSLRTIPGISKNK